MKTVMSLLAKNPPGQKTGERSKNILPRDCANLVCSRRGLAPERCRQALILFVPKPVQPNELITAIANLAEPSG